MPKSGTIMEGVEGASTAVELLRCGSSGNVVEQDFVAVEEPLEIRIAGVPVAVTMRTPGDDVELAAGFVLSEGLLQNADIASIRRCAAAEQGNVVDVLLTGDQVDTSRLTRHVFASSSCGLCGKATIDSVRQQFHPIASPFQVAASVLRELPARMAGGQAGFARTGAVHAAAIFDRNGALVVLREDVGRHNAVDKALGYGALRGIRFAEHILLVSGRASFEIMQKALGSSIPVVCAISAPSSLAVEFAQESGQALVGFLRDGCMNIYAGAERVLQT